jgi:DNA-3-methyladenine glycosylase II
LIFAEKLEIVALQPFSFDLSAEIFANGDRQLRSYEKGRFRQVIRANGKLILATVESVGTVDKPKLSAELNSDRELTQEDKKKAEEAIRVLFNLNFDLAPFYEETKSDKVMAHLTQKLWGLKSPTTQTVFEALLDSIVEQQISLKVANSMEKKLIKKFGDALDLEGKVYYAYPTPQRMALASVEELRQCGLSQRKAEYITSASMLILEALPADDLGLRRAISHYYCGGKAVTGSQAREIAKGWGKWKGLAAYYLVVAETLGIEP